MYYPSGSNEDLAVPEGVQIGSRALQVPVVSPQSRRLSLPRYTGEVAATVFGSADMEGLMEVADEVCHPG